MLVLPFLLIFLSSFMSLFLLVDDAIHYLTYRFAVFYLPIQLSSRNLSYFSNLRCCDDDHFRTVTWNWACLIVRFNLTALHILLGLSVVF